MNEALNSQIDSPKTQAYPYWYAAWLETLLKIVDMPHIVNAMLLMSNELAPGRLVTRPQTTLPTVLVIPMTDTSNIAWYADRPDNIARSETENRVTLIN